MLAYAKPAPTPPFLARLGAKTAETSTGRAAKYPILNGESKQGALAPQRRQEASKQHHGKPHLTH